MAWNLIVSRKDNQEYTGPAEKCSFSFSLWPDEIPGTRWAAEQVMNTFVDELATQNSQLLELKMWEDTSPTIKTDYYVEVTATASPLFWALIIYGVFAALIGLVIYFTIVKIEDIAKYVGEKAPELGQALKYFAIASIGVVGLLALNTLARRK